jgi:hypothetical protein
LSDWIAVAGARSRSGSLAGSVGVKVVEGAYASVLSARCVLSDEIPASAASGALEGALGEDASDSVVDPGEGDTDACPANGVASSGGAPFAVSGFAPYSFVG